MKKLLAMILGGMGSSVANISDSLCPVGWIDEPEMSKSMIER